MKATSEELAVVGKAEIASACPFCIVESEVGHGKLGLNGDLGYGKETVTNAHRFRWLASAHSPSRLVILVKAPLRLRGFLNGTAQYCAGASFQVNGKAIGTVRCAYDLTKEYLLQPGCHVLEITQEQNNYWCHTVWGFESELDLSVAPEHYVAVGAIAKNENAYLKEWVDHHRSIGVTHFFLLDNGSKIPLEQTVREEGLSAWVTVDTFPTCAGQHTQNAAYMHLLWKYGPRCFWMAFIDLDEFIVPKMSPQLPQMMRAYEEYGGLMVKWVVFGSGGHTERPVSQREAYRECHPSWYVKSIVQPKFVARVEDPHQFAMLPNRPRVSELFERNSYLTQGSRTSKHIQINHYFSRSKVEWIEKMQRGNLSGKPNYSWTDFEENEAKCTSHDNSIQSLENEQRRARIIPSRKVVGFMHVAVANHWQAVLQLQINKMEHSGLLDIVEKVYIGIVGAERSIIDEAEVLRRLPEKFEVAFVYPSLQLYEFPTIKLLQEYCRAQECFAFYIHTKGVVNSYQSQHDWRNRMEQFVLVHYERALNALMDGSPAAGSVAHHDLRWVFPGNFWWIKSEHAAALVDVNALNHRHRWDAEGWIARNGVEGFYWDEDGGTFGQGYKIAGAQVTAGRVSTNGWHSWDQIPVLASKRWRFDQAISAHGPSSLKLKNTVPLIIFGFVSGSGEEKTWHMRFAVNSVGLGTLAKPWERTRSVYLPPGEHDLQIEMPMGESWGAHTCWGIRNSNIHEVIDGHDWFPSRLKTRTEILKSLIQLRGYKTYLEIGLGDGSNFRALPCAVKISVDPAVESDFKMTSDDFFQQNQSTFDLVFIDGLHHADVVARDIANALRVLNPGGAIVCHDLNPKTELVQRVPRASGPWTGDCWKAWVALRGSLPDALVAVADTDYGVGILIPKAARPTPKLAVSAEDMHWENFHKHRNEWLNLISPEGTFKLLMKDGWDINIEMAATPCRV